MYMSNIPFSGCTPAVVAGDSIDHHQHQLPSYIPPMDKLAMRKQATVESPWGELVPEVMALMVETCADHLDTKSLCSLLQVNNTCRTVIQGSRGHHSISIKPTMAIVTGLKAWLPKWAGLVAELCLLSASDSWYGEQQPPVSKEVIHDLMSAIKQYSVSPAANSATNSSAAAHHHTADNSSAAASTPGMPLLLKRFCSTIPMPPSALEALPAAGLTRLQLRSHFDRPAAAQVQQALQQLTNLEHLIYTNHWETCVSQAVCQALPSLTRLTGLDIGPLVTADANSCLPTSLVELKLQLRTLVRAEAADSAHDAGADSVDYGWWSGEQEEEQVTEEQHKAARLLDLTSLPLLHCCQVKRDHPSDYMSWQGASPPPEEWGYDHDYTDLVTLRLAAPHLTRLVLINHFKDVEGLQDCTKLQQCLLEGCAIPARRLAQVVPRFPLLRDFRWFGDEQACGDCYMQLDSFMLLAPVDEQQQLATAISGATQLTSLFIFGLTGYGFVKVQDGGKVTLNWDGRLNDSDYSGWGEKVCGLTSLQELVIDASMPDADVLQLTKLTALTYLQLMDPEGPMSSASIRDQVLSKLPRLDRFDPGMFDGPMYPNIEW